MKYGLKENHLAKISGVIKSNPKIRRILIYGSRARGNYKDGSDIDLCVEADDLSFGELNSIRANLDDLMLPYKIDLIDMNCISSEELRKHILRVGGEI